MSEVITKIDALCHGRNINYSQIFEMAYQTSTGLKSNDFIEFNAVVQNLISKNEKDCSKRFSAGIRHLLWAENYLYFLYKSKKNIEIKKFCEFYENFQPKSNVDDYTFYNILKIYNFMSGATNLELDLKKFELLFKKPKNELYTYLYLIWKSLEIVHSKIRENLENYNSNQQILTSLEYCLHYLELGLVWDKTLKKEKFLRLETESYSYLKKVKGTISQLRGNTNTINDGHVQTGIKLFNDSVKLFNEKNYSKTIEYLKKACSLFQKKPIDEIKTKPKLEKCFALLGKVYYVQELFDDASVAFLESIYYSNFEEEKYPYYIDQFVKSNMKSGTSKRNLTVLSKKLSKETMELLLNEELKALQIFELNYKKPTSSEQLLILDFMLSEIYEKQSPEYLMKMMDREKILVSRNYDLNSIQNAINICNKNIELLQNKNYDELALTYCFKELLKIHYHILMMKNKVVDWNDWKEDDNSKEMCENILKLMQTRFDFKYFRSSIKLWCSLLQQCSPQNIGKYIKDLDRSFNNVEIIVDILDYYGETELQINSLNLLKLFNNFREESNSSIDIKLAKIYIDLGYVNKAESILLEIENQQDEEEEDVLLFGNIIKSYLLMEKGEIEKSQKTLSQLQKSCKGKSELLSLCRYYLSQVSFYQNDPDSIDTSLTSLSSRMKKFSISNITQEFLNSEIDSMDYSPIVTSLLQVGNFYESRGSVNESFYFYNQGLLLATLTYSQHHVMQFLMSFGEMEQRKHKFINSKYFLSAAQKLCEMTNLSELSIARIQNVANLIQLADVYRIYQRFDDAKRLLDEASMRLKNWKHPEDTNDEIDSTKIQSLKAHLSLSYHILEESSVLEYSNGKMIPTEEVLIHQFMAQKYKEEEEIELAKSLYSKIFGLTGYMIPRFTRSSLSSLAELSQANPYLSCYLSNMSVAVSLRLKKLKMIKNQDIVESFSNMGINDSNLFNLQKSNEEGINFIKKFQKTIPSNMIVCTLGISDDFSHLILTRITEKNEPILELIPLIKSKEMIQSLCEYNNLENYLDEDFEYSESISENNQYWKYQMKKKVSDDEESCLFSAFSEILSILKESDETGKQINIKKKSWWNMRYELDSRMKNLIEYLEYIILGDFTKNLHDLDYKKSGSNSKTIVKTRRRKVVVSDDEEISPTKTSTTERVHTVLILDKYLQKFPWESIPSLRSKSISRMPSILFLYQQLLNKPKLIDLTKTSYLLNPSGDLKNTQKTFEKYFEKENWTGTTKEPSNDEFKSTLESNDFFIYMGHGGAEKYFRPSEISKLNKCAVTLLMGCSSGNLIENGEHEPTGTALNYILGNCPCLIANLWDVTDVDIDRFSLELLECFKNEDDKSLVDCIPLAREKCKLKYLIGCAPVCYGIPVFKKTF
eukprot:gene7482-11806_t